jgi:hypothetical protein
VHSSQSGYGLFLTPLTVTNAPLGVNAAGPQHAHGLGEGIISEP